MDDIKTFIKNIPQVTEVKSDPLEKQQKKKRLILIPEIEEKGKKTVEKVAGILWKIYDEIFIRKARYCNKCK